MGIRTTIKWLVFKLYNVGASVVIFGLIAKLIGYGWSDIAVIAGLFTECVVFILTAFVINEVEDEKEKENKVDENNKFKRIYYMNENGRYYMENPNYIQATYENPMRVVGVPYRKNPPLEYYSISSEIEKLSEQLEGLKAIRDEEMKKYVAENPDYDKNSGVKKGKSNSVQKSGKIKEKSKKVRISQKKK